ncbi:MAG: NADP-dependent oxidoreductase [Solirubrobacteraceae bacterium]|nr:NADP-dependent oxidoreductase [Patulibacter sp.]
MRAVAITRPGGPDVLEIVERADRDPGRGEVRIAVRAAAVNPTDVLMRQGGGGDLPQPWIPGMDAAGTIEAVGEGVDRFAVGDEVMAAASPRRPDGGAQAERLVVPAASVVPIPDGASLEEAATLPMNGLTAKLGLELLGLEPGSTLAVSGGAGLLASYVIPLAKAAGLRVVADAKPEDVDLVRGFGADEIVPRSDDFGAAVRAAVPEGVDGVYDTALLHERVFCGLRDGGTTVVVRGWAPDHTERDIVVRQVMVRDALERTEWLDELRALVSDGRIRLRVAQTFPVDQVGAAQDLMDAGGLRGRAVLVF